MLRLTLNTFLSQISRKRGLTKLHKISARKHRRKLEGTKIIEVNEDDIEEEIEHDDMNYNTNIKNLFETVVIISDPDEPVPETPAATVPIKPDDFSTHSTLF